MKTVLLLVLIVSAIAIVGGGGLAATDAGRHRNTSVATEAGAPLLPDGRPGGAHRA